MSTQSKRVLFIGDIVGRTGRKAVKKALPGLKKRYRPHLIIANGENLAGGYGLTEKTAEEMFHAGVDLFTTGNHIWDKKESIGYIDKEDRILRPLNYPPGVPGRGTTVVSVEGTPVTIINLAGRVFMNHLDCPFRTVDEKLRKIQDRPSIIIVDFHAEATSEKLSMGYFLDGRVSAVVGTHTHVQTADERILPKGTAYITDVGMCGALDSVIGMKYEDAIYRLTTQMPRKFETARGRAIFCGVYLEISPEDGRALSIERIKLEVD